MKVIENIGWCLGPEPKKALEKLKHFDFIPKLKEIIQFFIFAKLKRNLINIQHGPTWNYEWERENFENTVIVFNIPKIENVSNLS